MASDLSATKSSLVAAAQTLLRDGLVEGTSGNLSVRVDGDRAVLTPSSLPYETMTPEDLVVTDLEGNVLDGERSPTSEKALHLACMRAHDDIGAVIHSHAKYSTMLRRLSEHSERSAKPRIMGSSSRQSVCSVFTARIARSELLSA